MPRITEERATGWAHCPDARCPGYTQQEVPAVKTVKEVTCVDRGGDLNLVENSFERFQFVDESDRPCPACERPRVVTGEPRIAYPPMSGHDPMGLLRVGGFDPSRQPPASPGPGTPGFEEAVAAAVAKALAEKEKVA